LRPTFFSAIFVFGGFNNISKSVISSGLSGFNPIVYFQLFFSNIDATSCNLFSVCTLTTAGLFSVPNFAFFLPLNSELPRPVGGVIHFYKNLNNVLILVECPFNTFTMNYYKYSLPLDGGGAGWG